VEDIARSKSRAAGATTALLTVILENVAGAVLRDRYRFTVNQDRRAVWPWLVATKFRSAEPSILRRSFRLRCILPAALHETWGAVVDSTEEFRQSDLKDIAKRRECKNRRVGESTLDLRHKCPVDLGRKR
jgi:hypothetical protein